MIRFQCSHCGKTLGIAATEAGKMIKCPACGEKVRVPAGKAAGGPAAKPPGPVRKAPAPPPKRRPADEVEEEEVADVEPVEEEEERRPARKVKVKRRSEDVEEDEDEEEERPRRKSRRRREAEDYEEDGASVANRIRGGVGIVVGAGVVAASFLIEKFQHEDFVAAKYTILGLGVLLVVAGIVYLIRG
jgi:DNA-directed RNA polymerase subunit RPC12/RpoP